MNNIGHKDYTTQPETFNGQLPSTYAIEVSDMFLNKQSASDVQGKIRIDGKKLSKSVINTVYKHIKEVETTTINILNGSSLIYFPPNEQIPIMDGDIQLVDEETGQLLFEDGDPLWGIPDIPDNKNELIENLMFAVQLDGGQYANVYDATFEELIGQISHIVDNVIGCQVANGTGTFDDLKTAIS